MYVNLFEFIIVAIWTIVAIVHVFKFKMPNKKEE